MGNMLVMGKKIDQFELPVCNKFKRMIANGQLCYTLDVNEFMDQIEIEKAMKTGLIFVMDYNDESMITAREVNGNKGLSFNFYD